MKTIIMIAMLFAPMAVMAQKFGHIDSQRLIQQLPDVARISGELEALSKQYEDQFKTKQDELNRKIDEYEKSKATMSAAAQKETEASLMEQVNKLQQETSQKQQEFDKKQQEMLTPLMDKIKTAIMNVGKAGHYTYIFEESAALFVGEDSKDVSAEVKAELDKMK